MKKASGILILILMSVIFMAASSSSCVTKNQEEADARIVQDQQAQYAKGQPIPSYDWSLERDLVIQLYNIRNRRVATYSVWRSDYGMIEGDCASIGFGLPYDTSLTNPMQPFGGAYGYTSIGQAEPNGVFASTNTSATWIMCVGSSGDIEPHYVESKVAVYPYPVNVSYADNRVTRKGVATASINIK